jgi:hypothetical protein
VEEIYEFYSTDASRGVRHSIMEVLGEVIAGFQQDHVPDSLLNHFLNMGQQPMNEHELAVMCAFSFPGNKRTRLYDLGKLKMLSRSWKEPRTHILSSSSSLWYSCYFNRGSVKMGADETGVHEARRNVPVADSEITGLFAS